LERAIDQAIEAAPEVIRSVIEGLQSLRGVARISAATIVAELGQLSRFGRAKQLMGYAGVVSSEHSSGERIRRGAITKTGNAHLRRILVEAAWAYRHRPYLGGELRRRQKNASENVPIRVGLKEREDPIPLCYCFGFSVADVRREITETGRCTIPARITAEVRAGQCSCEITNPSGTCCLGEVNRAVNQEREAVQAGAQKRPQLDRAR
jgi:hypothetical protein